MNIEQIKKDIDNGVMISKITVVKLVEAALMMENELERLCADGNEYASDCLGAVDEL